MSKSGDLGGFSMTGLFLMEAETQAQTLSEGLLKLEKSPEGDCDIAGLMRAAHSLKGGARIVQAEALVDFAHAMEDYFVAVSKGDLKVLSVHIDRLLEGVDLMEGMVAARESGFPAFIEGSAERFKLLSGLYRAFIKGGDFEVRRDPEALKYEMREPESAAAPLAELALSSVVPVPSELAVTQKFASEKDGFVKVSTGRMEHLIGLAGEAFSHAKKLRSLEDRFGVFRKLFAEWVELLEPCLGDDGGALRHHDRERLKTGLADLTHSLSGVSAQFPDFGLELEGFADTFYNVVVSCKIVPFEDLAKMFSRMVRDMSKTLGKKVNLEIIGAKTGLDRDIMEKLEAPLNHLLRNAMDHGLEMPAERLAAGKPETGSIVSSAFHWGGMFNITMTDDGRGIDIANVRELVVERGLASREMVDAMPAREVLDFLFLPGFTTRRAVSELSGRGVGLDVVMNMVQEVKGEVTIDTKLGAYTTFHLRLPVTLSIISAMVAEIGGELYAFPSSRIDCLLCLPSKEIITLENRQFVRYGDRNVGLVGGRGIFGYDEQREMGSGDVHVLVMSDRYNQYGMVVDRFVGEEKMVARPMDKRLGKLSCINSASVLEDGSLVLVADVEDVVRAIDNHVKSGSLRKLGIGEAATEKGAAAARILVVDDSITVRELEKHILEPHGYVVDTAVNGMDGWNAVRTGDYDLVITDIDMPRMNGFELVGKIRSDSHLATLPVIIVSYKDREEDKLKGMECGANYYLTKSSFHDNTLVEAVGKLLGGMR